MEMLKRNLGLTIFLALSLVVAAVLIVFTRQHANAVRKNQDEFEDVKSFVSSLRQQKIAITDENLRVARENSEIAERELESLKEVMRERSELTVEPMTSVQFKNNLVSKTRDMVRDLTRSNVRVAEASAGFSFSETLQASTLPNQEVEVPVLNRQLLMVQELVRLLSDSGVRELLAVDRVAGLGSIELDDYRVTRFSLQVAGPLKSVKSLVTDLQLKSKYFLYVPSVALLAESDVSVDMAKSPYTQSGRTTRRSSRSSDRGRSPAEMDRLARMEMSISANGDFARSDTGEGGQGDGEDGSDDMAERLPKADRAVVFRDYVTATIPVHFIEFTQSR